MNLNSKKIYAFAMLNINSDVKLQKCNIYFHLQKLSTYSF